MSYPEVGSDGSYIYDAQSDEECGTRGKVIFDYTAGGLGVEFGGLHQ